jgi:hypothetical protein
MGRFARKFRPTRADRTSGIEHLDWEAGLRHEQHETLDDSLIEKPTGQAIAASEIITLYLWWVDIRPNRPEPGDASGSYKAHEALTRSGYKWFSKPTADEPHLSEWAKDKDDPLYRVWSEKADLSHEIEERYHAEDEEMMKRLVAIRRSMWT